ncbi:Na+/H+ antiporter subunit B [Roseibium aestuarii]|uniref:Na+/H+ antiporter subunit B n=1 Tax=Roseibium aestuarii TaxID=2600299 RepID=A0ABW4JS36_9HYPH|nr:Na+/H+ antiporter subunit B [Roseibium aestuarii]
MNTIIFRTIAPYLAALMILFSIFVLLRGHNEPGGGFIGGLIAASALAIYGIACGVTSVRRAIRVHPMSLAAFGLFIAALAGLPSLVLKQSYMTTQFVELHAFGTQIDLLTPMLFDLGVYFVVVGAISSIALALEERESD